MERRSAADRAEPPCRLVRFEASDGVTLAGALYEPRRTSRRAIVWIHGGGGASVFESRRTNILARLFISRGLAYFPFNNRGSGIVRRAGDDLGGSAFERIRDSVADIDVAIRELWRRGYRDITLAGHSTGANKIAVYDHYKPRNRAKRYVFLAGGDDTGLLYAELGPRRFKALLAKARGVWIPGGDQSRFTRTFPESTGIPEAIPLEMCYLGWQDSLAQLATLVEPEIPG